MPNENRPPRGIPPQPDEPGAFEAEVHVMLRQALEMSGMSQAELARAMGTSQPYISHLLSGKRFSPSLRTVSRIFEACGVASGCWVRSLEEPGGEEN